MSSILKALRKVEDENAAIGGGSVDLAHDILKRNYDQPQTARWPIYVLGISFIFVLASAGFWLLSTETGSQMEKHVPIVQPETQVPEHNELEPSIAVEESIDHHVKLDGERGEAPVNKNTETKQLATVEIPPLRVDEIVYHQDPGARLAVINDLPVMEGTEIDGAHIDEILPDGVRCSFQGLKFKISKEL
ncbi:general secretion pathway protein GspB [Malonomonas rubra]|uniref:general secretion pathway protein GspB n=1 Tax=Malonomonas rubra TaxID=57040 RepID=UPI0026EABE8B|nr:general secretion pathway protein GspB [Malonomonas rubra]